MYMSCIFLKGVICFVGVQNWAQCQRLVVQLQVDAEAMRNSSNLSRQKYHFVEINLIRKTYGTEQGDNHLVV